MYERLEALVVSVFDERGLLVVLERWSVLFGDVLFFLEFVALQTLVFVRDRLFLFDRELIGGFGPDAR
jgi:hypothetical protein